MFCRKCGIRLTEEAEFCHKCGTKIYQFNEQADKNGTDFDVEEQSEQEELGYDYEPTFESGESEENIINPVKQKRKPTAIILIVVIAIVLLAIVGFFAVKLFTEDEPYIKSVKEWVPLDNYGFNYTCGEIFERYLDDAKWKQFADTGNSYIVEVSGSVKGVGKYLVADFGVLPYTDDLVKIEVQSVSFDSSLSPTTEDAQQFIYNMFEAYDAGYMDLTTFLGSATSSLPNGESNPLPSVKENPASDFQYEYNQALGGIEIKKYIGRDSVVNIPSKIDGINVVKIGGYPGDFFAEGAFVGCTDVTGVNIPYGVREIGESAFSGCSRLNNITIPDSVTTIESYAFSNCTSLSNFTIPKSVIEIGDYVFASCSGISEIIVDKNNPCFVTDNSALYNKNMTKLIFYYGSKQGSITIPYGVTEIGGYAFEGCYGLTNIDIPSSVTKIGYRSFSGCTGLTSIEIPYGVTEIGWSAFCDCSSLLSVVIPGSVKHIGQCAFGNCVSLTKIKIPNSVESIDYYAFEGCYADIYFKEGIYSPGNYYMLYGTY